MSNLLVLLSLLVSNAWALSDSQDIGASELNPILEICTTLSEAQTDDSKCVAQYAVTLTTRASPLIRNTPTLSPLQKTKFSLPLIRASPFSQLA